MHTTESKWQDMPLRLARDLEFSLELGLYASPEETRKAAATIRALVQALEQKIRELDSLEPSE